jgi:cell division control protein CDC15
MEEYSMNGEASLKQATLLKYQDIDSGPVYTDDFHLEKSDHLSFSKFSSSGSSVVVEQSRSPEKGINSPFFGSIKSENIEVFNPKPRPSTSHSQRNSLSLSSTSHTSSQMSSGSDSDIHQIQLRGMENALQLTPDLKHPAHSTNGDRKASKHKKRPIKAKHNLSTDERKSLISSFESNTPHHLVNNEPVQVPTTQELMAPIPEDKTTFLGNDENISPQLRPMNSNRAPDHIFQPSKIRNGGAEPRFPLASQLQTPQKHNRLSSVKVSLTPAQRFEKKPDIRLNNALENFKFSTLVGKGAFASVYRGVNLTTNKVIAIKQILLESDQNVMELMGEIDLLKILKHPNIVKYHGFVKTSTSLNVFLEYCSGGSLRQLYKRLKHGLPEEQIIKYVKLILKGLNYLHEQGVVHRDVKAANVLIDGDGEIKLADFGVSARVTSQHQTVVGTPNWMAPETVLGGEGLCTASDIWSLGATIIELFTTNPPYHDLNPMATLHAIGIDDHPPLPKNTSPVAKDFLLECFQKQPGLRSSAKILLKHKWFGGTHAMNKPSSVNLNLPNHDIKPMASYSEVQEENWNDDFADVSKLKSAEVSLFKTKDSSTINALVSKLSKADLLSKFCEENSEESSIFRSFSGLEIDRQVLQGTTEPNEVEEEDPFLEIDIESFDTKELEIQTKMEYLITRFTNKVDNCRSGNDHVLDSLIKITGRMLHLVKKYPTLHLTLIREHGLLSLMELLDEGPALPKSTKLWFQTLAILNEIFEHSPNEFETYCLLGGIPSITHFKHPSYNIQVRLQVVRFISHFGKSEKALSMLVSSGGLRIVSKFIEEDFETAPSFPLTAVECIHGILTRDLTRFKSDLCRILSRHGVVFWFIVLLNKLTNPNLKRPKSLSLETVKRSVNQILDIIKFFTQSEARVRINIANAELFKLLIKTYKNLEFVHQSIVLKYFKSISMISETLNLLHQADILEFLMELLESYNTSSSHYKEVMSIVCPMLYNCCYLNHHREHQLVELGAVPYLKSLAQTNLPFRQFVLPILCELVYCDNSVRQVLKQQDILTLYFNLLLDPYWQSNAMDSIIVWIQEDRTTIDLKSTRAITCILTGFFVVHSIQYGIYIG